MLSLIIFCLRVVYLIENLYMMMMMSVVVHSVRYYWTCNAHMLGFEQGVMR
jgi:hypothetical protein